MQSQYKYRAKYIRDAAEPDIDFCDDKDEGLKRIHSQVNALADDQFRGVNEKIESLIPIISKTPNLLAEISDTVLSILIFDFLIRSLDGNIQQRIFKYWDDHLTFKDRLTFHDVQKILKSSESYAQFVEGLCEIYAMNFYNGIDSFQIICQIRVYLTKFLKQYEFSRPRPSNRCVQIEELLFSLDNFIVVYREARDKYSNINFIEQ